MADTIAGLCSGSSAAFVGAPFDTIRVRLQGGHFGYTGVLHCTRDTCKRAGVRGLWAGCTPQVASLSLLQSIGFTAFGLALTWLQPAERGGASRSTWQRTRTASNRDLVFAGTLSGLPVTFVQTPLDRIKCLLQANATVAASERLSAPGWCRALARVPPARGFFAGFWATALRATGAGGLYFIVFENTRRGMERLAPASDRMDLASRFCSGGVAGCAAWLLVNPLEAIKSYQQALPTEPLPSGEQGRSIRHAVSHLRAAHGWGWIGVGMGPILVRAFLVNALTMLVYTEVSEKLAARGTGKP